jgi:hypothetical protein
MTSSAALDDTLAAFSAEMLDDTVDLGALGSVALHVDPAAVWAGAHHHAATLVADTTPAASGRRAARRRAGIALLRTLTVNPHTPTGTLTAAVHTAADARTSSTAIDAAVTHPNRDTAVLRTIVDRYGIGVVQRHGKLSDPHLPHDLLRTIVDRYASDQQLAEICERPDLDAEFIDWLTGERPDPSGRLTRPVPAHRVAHRVGLPRAVYRHLAQHRSHNVRCAVARNTSTDADTLALLAGDADLMVRYHVAHHANTELAVVEQLSGDPIDDVAGAAHSRLYNDDWPPARHRHRHPR